MEAGLISIRSTWGVGLAVLIQLTATPRITAQAIPKPDYVTYLPREILLPVHATAGNLQFHLFGDSSSSSYRDEAPRDGIDDAREHWLRVATSPSTATGWD